MSARGLLYAGGICLRRWRNAQVMKIVVVRDGGLRWFGEMGRAPVWHEVVDCGQRANLRLVIARDASAATTAASRQFLGKVWHN